MRVELRGESRGEFAPDVNWLKRPTNNVEIAAEACFAKNVSNVTQRRGESRSIRSFSSG